MWKINGVVVRPKLDPPVVSAEWILKMQKYHDVSKAPRSVFRAAERMALEASQLACPSAIIKRLPVTSVDPEGEVRIADTHCFNSKSLARRLANASDIFTLALTVGDQFEKRSKELIEEDKILDGLLLDTGAWVAIEKLQRDLRRRMSDIEARNGNRLSSRTAPGYGDWSVSEQGKLLNMFGDESLPVTLCDSSFMMAPRKSLTAIYAVIPAKSGG